MNLVISIHSTASNPLLLLHSANTTTAISSCLCNYRCRRRGSLRPGVVLRSSAGGGNDGIPGRDRVIDFGKHKGKMLGSLSSDYLKWVSKKLRAGELEEWAKLADQVLNDPVYRDRMEWELAQKLLEGDPVYISSNNANRIRRGEGSPAGSVVYELVEISRRFGWDNDDKAGWSQVDFGLLGTSKGGRIPRMTGNREIVGMKKRELKEKCVGEIGMDHDDGTRKSGSGSSSSSSSGRQRRRERLRSKKQFQLQEKELGTEEDNGTGRMMMMGLKGAGTEAIFCDDKGMNGHGHRRTNPTPNPKANPFPGRESLLKKVQQLHNHRTRFS